MSACLGETGVFLQEGAGYTTKVIEPNTIWHAVSKAVVPISTLQVNEFNQHVRFKLENLHSVALNLKLSLVYQ